MRSAPVSVHIRSKFTARSGKHPRKEHSDEFRGHSWRGGSHTSLRSPFPGMPRPTAPVSTDVHRSLRLFPAVASSHRNPLRPLTRCPLPNPHRCPLPAPSFASGTSSGRTSPTLCGDGLKSRYVLSLDYLPDPSVYP
jgi:hypothetical protein